MLQVWTRFAKFDEIHLNSSPKNLRKFGQPLGALRGHLTKSQLQKKFLHAKSFRRTPEGHCFCQVQKFSKQFQELLSFSSEPFVDLASSHDGALLPVPSFLSLRRTIVWRLAGVGDEQAEVRHPVSDGSGAFAAARERRSADGAAQATRGRRVALHSPVRPPRRGSSHYAKPGRSLAGERHQ